MKGSPDLTLPKVRHVGLEGFTLYTKEPDLDIEVPPGVFCLAGANGLGKSTFLAALNLGITGIVPDPDRVLKSHSRHDGGYIEEYFRYHRTTSGYNESFFAGRISGADRDGASVTVHLDVGDWRFRLTRGIFDPGGLRAFEVLDAEGDTVYDGESHTMSEREAEYHARLTEAIGLGSFEQFVFLQHFVFTFDEGRHLLLWNQRSLNHALHLCIGSDFDRANEADALQRQMERAGSLGRNIQYQASGVRSRIDALLDALGDEGKPSDDGPTPEEVERAHKVIEEGAQTQRDKVSRKLGELRDAELKWAGASSRLSALQSDFSREFSLHVHKRSRVELHPVIAATLSEGECAVCGTDGVADGVKARVDEGHCPLCATELPAPGPDGDSVERLKEIDERVAEAKEALDQASADKNRVAAEAQAAGDRLTALQKELREFEEANRRVLLQSDSGGAGSVRDTVKRLEDELEHLLNQKDAKYKERDRKKRQLVKLQRELERQYDLAEDEFVPLFQRLAYSFLGIELFVHAEANEGVSSIGLSLVLEMRGSVRRQDHQLSESQRFFLDIALRMAMAQYMSRDGSEATLFVDTPEGSLDIAYEARAGAMFAEFVELGHDILMTANINSSQILRRLAAACGRERMAVQRMTSWTDLSDVQLREDKLFRDAYDVIEKALDGEASDEETLNEQAS